MDVDGISPADGARLTERLLPEEMVIAAFRASATALLFTDRRILMMQRQTLLNERLETSSFSYRAIRRFSLTEGEDSRSEIRIWLGGDPQPLHLRANGDTDFGPLQCLLAERLH